MITIEIKASNEHKNGEFAYDLMTLANSFYPEKECQVVTREDWSDREDYPLRILWKDKEVLETVLEDYNKEVVKRAAYRFFSRRSNSALPWGILTGIRPA